MGKMASFGVRRKTTTTTFFYQDDDHDLIQIVQNILYTIHHGEGALGATGCPGSNRLPSERHVSPALKREARRGLWICRFHLPNRPNKTYGPYTTRGPYTTCSDATVSPFVFWREEADTGHEFGSYTTIKVYVTINASTILAPYFQVGAA